MTQIRYKPNGQAPPEPRWRPLPLLAKACKKVYFGALAGTFTLVSTAATPLLGLWNVLTSAAPQDPNACSTLWKRFWASRAVTVFVRLGAAAVASAVLVAVQAAFPSALDLAAFLLTLPFAFIGAIPFVHVVLPRWVARPAAAAIAAVVGKTSDEDPNLPYMVYVGAVALADVALHVMPPPLLHGFWATPLGISSLVFAASALVPLTWAGVIRAWAQAGERDEAGNVQIWVHQGFAELYSKDLGEHADDDKTDKAVGVLPGLPLARCLAYQGFC